MTKKDIKQCFGITSRTIIKKITILLISLLFVRCSIYSPSISPPVVIDKKGQVQLDGNVSVSNSLLIPVGLHASAAYGITDNVSVQLSASHILRCNNEFDVALGYYQNINKKFRIGAFPGFNIGYVFLDEKYVDIMGGQSYTESWRGYYYSPYLRLQLLFNNKYITIGLGTKAGIYCPSLTVDGFPKNQKALLVEPMIFIMPSLWNDNLKISVNSSFTKLFPIDNRSIYFNDDYSLDYNSLILSVGLNYRFNLNQNIKN